MTTNTIKISVFRGTGTDTVAPSWDVNSLETAFDAFIHSLKYDPKRVRRREVKKLWQQVR